MAPCCIEGAGGASDDGDDVHDGHKIKTIIFTAEPTGVRVGSGVPLRPITCPQRQGVRWRWCVCACVAAVALTHAGLSVRAGESRIRPPHCTHRIAAVALYIYSASLQPAAASTRKEGRGGGSSRDAGCCQHQEGEGGRGEEVCVRVALYTRKVPPCTRQAWCISSLPSETILNKHITLPFEIINILP